jgi:hypothetical protein
MRLPMDRRIAMHAVAVGDAWLLIGNNHRNAALLIKRDKHAPFHCDADDGT